MAGKATGAGARLLAAAYFAVLLAAPLFAEAAYKPADKDALVAALEACCTYEGVGTSCANKGGYWNSWTGYNCMNGTNGDDPIDEWDTSLVTDMSQLFQSAYLFNIDLSEWDVSSVTDMSYLFQKAYAFTSDLSDWNMSSVTDMSYLFHYAKKFSSDLSDWDVSKVTNMYYMFSGAENFNSSLGDWDVSSVTDIGYMFQDAYVFESDLSDWKVGDVTNMVGTFRSAKAFNSDLSDWDVSSVTDTSFMFYKNYEFDSDLSDWDVSSVTDAGSMFSKAYEFDSDLSTWVVSSVTRMSSMFKYAHKFDSDLSDWDVSSVSYFGSMFKGAESFNGNLTGWNMYRDVDIANMFQEMFVGAFSFRAIGLDTWKFSPWSEAEFEQSGLYTIGVCVPFAIDENKCILPTCSGADTVPEDGTKGDCPASLTHGERCTPGCTTGYKGYGLRLCDEGTLIDEFTCVADPVVCLIETPEESGEGTPEEPTSAAPTSEAPTSEAPTDDDVDGAPLAASLAPAVLGLVALAALLPAF